MVQLTSKGDFSKITKFLQSLDPHYIYRKLNKYGKLGVEALQQATPVDTGLTAASWYYTVTVNDDSASITWHNSNTNEGVPIAILIQYGHGMPNGGYVRGIDYINPALKPVFEEISDRIWKEVTKK